MNDQGIQAKEEDGRWWLELNDELETVLNFVQNMRNGTNTQTAPNTAPTPQTTNKNMLYLGLGVLVLVVVLVVVMRKK